MDAVVGTLIAVVGGGGTMVTVGVAIGKSLTTRRDIQAHAARLALIPERPDEVYARKDVIAVELTAIKESLDRIETAMQRSGGAGV